MFFTRYRCVLRLSNLEKKAVTNAINDFSQCLGSALFKYQPWRFSLAQSALQRKAMLVARTTNDVLSKTLFFFR